MVLVLSKRIAWIDGSKTACRSVGIAENSDRNLAQDVDERRR
jgi:hypothetical protein